MVRSKTFYLGLFLLPLIAVAGGTVVREKGNGKSVRVGENGKLVYGSDAKGNRLPDFSNVGYHSGEKAIPDVRVRLTVSPAKGDNTAAIQKAIDEIGELRPDRDGIRGALLLKRGIYRVEGTLKILHSGVILRGEGCGPNGTVIVAAGYGDKKHKRTLITIGNHNKLQLKEDTRQAITDAYVPIGARSFTVASARGYKVGDRIALHRTGTDKWIKAIGGHKFRSTAWTAAAYTFNFERKITAISGKKITIDAPNVHPLDKEYGGGAILKYETPGRVFEVGIENLRLMSEFAKPTPQNPYGDPKETGRSEMHGWNAIKVGRNTENTWVRNVVGNYFGWSLVSISGKRATVTDCVNLGHASKITGGRRYPFMIDGQLNLMQRCVSFDGRHEFVNQARVAGPNVFIDCIGFRSRSLVGPHHRYAIGNLYDNVKSGHTFESRNAGNRGTGHGWTGTQTVFYNCTGRGFSVVAPPGGICWVIGCGKGNAKGVRFTPGSLYYRQVKERLGQAALDRLASKEQQTGMGKHLWVDALVKRARGNEK